MKYLTLILIVFITITQILGCSNGHYIKSAAEGSTAKSSSTVGASSELATIEEIPNDEYTILIKLSDKGDYEESQGLWIKYPDGNEEKLVSYKQYEGTDKITQGIKGIFNPQVSPDKSKIYFLTRTWVTSDAVHVVNIKTKEEKYICPGNSLEVIQSGSFKGKLIVNQHRYHKAGGSYDHYFLVDELGKEIKDLGEDFDEKVKEQLK